jgi:hypothetical protein
MAARNADFLIFIGARPEYFIPGKMPGCALGRMMP